MDDNANPMNLNMPIGALKFTVDDRNDRVNC
jgi:hypothetical protein